MHSAREASWMGFTCIQLCDTPSVQYVLAKTHVIFFYSSLWLFCLNTVLPSSLSLTFTFHSSSPPPSLLAGFSCSVLCLKKDFKVLSPVCESIKWEEVSYASGGKTAACEKILHWATLLSNSQTWSLCTTESSAHHVAKIYLVIYRSNVASEEPWVLEHPYFSVYSWFPFACWLAVSGAR